MDRILTKVDWFESKTDDEWTEYWFSRPIPLSEEDMIDLEDYVVWRAGKSIIKYRLSSETD